jgi:hypothetical protein
VGDETRLLWWTRSIIDARGKISQDSTGIN